MDNIQNIIFSTNNILENGERMCKQLYQQDNMGEEVKEIHISDSFWGIRLAMFCIFLWPLNDLWQQWIDPIDIIFWESNA